MKRNRTLPLALVTFAALTFASNAAGPTTTGATITDGQLWLQSADP